MKNIFLTSFALFLLVIFGCTPKIPLELEEIHQTQYATAWSKLDNYPAKYGRSDDLHFFTPNEGFVINSQGYLSYTKDGGENWEIVHENEGTFFRCILFNNRNEGWLGTIGTDDPLLSSRDTTALYQTTDGGETWSPVSFIGPTPKGLCGLFKVNDKMIVGTGRVRGPSYFIKTMDSGKTWYSYDLNHLAGSLISTYFFDEKRGLLIGGTTNDKENSRSLVLETLDGGMSWDTIYLSEQIGEYPWKFAFPNEKEGYISIQRNIREGRFYHLQTKDGGRTWEEVVHSPDYYYVQGIGFINEDIGWMGGSNRWTYETRDGGETWNKKQNIGNGFNNFQTFGDSLVYGVGFGVFKNPDVQSKGMNLQKTSYRDGSLRATFMIKEGRRNGVATFYHPNGTIAAKGKYKNNFKQGKWTYFDEQGQLTATSKNNGSVFPISEKDAARIVGDYQTESGGIRSIFMEDGKFYSQRKEGRKFQIFPESPSHFFYDIDADVTIEFIKNDQGEVTHSISYQNGGFSRATKL